MDILWALLIAGIANGAVYAMAGLTYNIMFSTSKVLSMTVGPVVMIGGVLGAFFIGICNIPAWLGAILVLVCGGLAGFITEWLGVRRVITKIEQHLYVLSTLALGIMIQEPVGFLWGTEPRPFPDIYGSGWVGLSDPKYYAPLILAILMIIAIELFYRKTMYGKAFLAVSQDTFAARARGIPVTRVRVMSYVLAGIIGSAAGFAAGKLTFAYFAVGHNFTMYGFIALALGGLGSNLGALVGGLILGIALESANYFFGGIYMDGVALAILISVLLIVPRGFFGVEGARRV
ncbi:MAG TPA: branched-chain amino acid ABC transporter permease [Thermodesulfobacteriota bacterium]|nr:branched-chain amino acid ABC transporter permease [Thermodesulfobacteriota bacterium]